MVKDLEAFKINKDDINMVNTLALAYIGDAIWEVYVRNQVLKDNINSKVNKLHQTSTKYVKASAQANVVRKLKEENIIDDELWQIVLRGRNGANHAPKNADVQDYNYATGFEALVGYLYLMEDFEKLKKVCQFSLDNIDIKNMQ